MKPSSRTFHLYRYQIIPTVETLQLDFLQPDINSIEDLKKKKNKIFEDKLLSQKTFLYNRSEITHQIATINGFFVLQIGVNRNITRIKKDFEEEILDNWPSAYIVINNDPDVQKIAIEEDRNAFYRTSTIANIISSNMNKELFGNKLTLDIKPTFQKSEFWEVVHQYNKKITKAEFFMVAPNLTNISKNLELDLGEIKKLTNSKNTNLSLESATDESLTLSENDSFTNSLVQYSSEGGGTIHLKIKSIRKKIKTEDSIRSVEIDDLVFQGENVSQKL
ncbi:MAG: hypothetical protein C0412_11640, partial [Flavobacterium sp.]|nr:hypothetical protein [Flavobacterium sp.]